MPDVTLDLAADFNLHISMPKQIGRRHATRRWCRQIAGCILQAMIHRDMSFADIAGTLKTTEQEVRDHFLYVLEYQPFDMRKVSAILTVLHCDLGISPDGPTLKILDLPEQNNDHT